MIAYNFQPAARNDAGSPANEGHGKLTRARFSRTLPFTSGAHPSRLGPEQLLVNRLVADLGRFYPRTLLVNYYVSLKTNPLVVLAGPQGTGKNALVEGVARAVLGGQSHQFVVIGSSSWAMRTSQSDYYQGLHERFGIMSLAETLQEAAAPGSAGKSYLVFLKGLHPDELKTFALLNLSPDGVKRLALPGLPLHEQPIVPPNVFITATLHAQHGDPGLHHDVLREVGLIELTVPRQFPATAPVVPPPPVGFQRLLQTARVASFDEALDRLGMVLGHDVVETLRPSPALDRALWHEGQIVNRVQHEAILTFVANSFDHDGRGLFEPNDPLHNAQMAYDAQVAQRVLWQMPDRADARRRLATFCDSGLCW